MDQMMLMGHSIGMLLLLSHFFSEIRTVSDQIMLLFDNLRYYWLVSY